MYSLLIYPLAAKANDFTGWAMRAFNEIRTTAVSSANAFTSLALTFACIIVVFLMIKLSNDLMSDDQHAGFGGVTLWQVLRPIVYLVMIHSFGLIITALDSVSSNIATSIASGVDTYKFEKIVYMNKQDQLAINTYLSSAWGDSGLSEKYNGRAVSYSELTKDDKARLASAATDKYASDIYNSPSISGTYDDIRHDFRERRGRRTFSKIMRQNEGFSVDESGQITVGGDVDVSESSTALQQLQDFELSDIVLWAFKYAFPIMVSAGQLLLCVLAMLGPWVLAFSLLPWSRQGFVSYIMTYIQISFWYPCGAIVYWATSNALNLLQSNKLSNELSRISGGVLAKSAYTAGQIDFLIIVFGAAGILMLTKVPSIASAIVPGGSSIGDAGGAGFSMVAGAAKATSNAPGKAASLLGKKGAAKATSNAPGKAA